MSIPQASIFYKMKTCFGLASNQQTNIKIFICMIHYKLNKYGASCMYIQFPIDMLVLLTVSSDPSALAFVWLVIHKLLSCSKKMPHHDGSLQCVDAPVGQRWRLAQPFFLHLEMFCFSTSALGINFALVKMWWFRLLSFTPPHASTWHQFCASIHQ